MRISDLSSDVCSSDRHVSVALWAQAGSLFPGHIRELSPSADAQTRTYAARVTLDAGRAGQPCELAYAFAGGDGVKAIDVTDKTAMATIGTLVYPTVAYCHQGWLSRDGRHLF